jgi:hypothetical protein
MTSSLLLNNSNHSAGLRVCFTHLMNSNFINVAIFEIDCSSKMRRTFMPSPISSFFLGLLACVAAGFVL